MDMQCESFDRLPKYNTPSTKMNRQRAKRTLEPPSKLPLSTSFMRVGDLELKSTSSASSSFHMLDDALLSWLIHGRPEDFFVLDENISFILS